MASLISFAGVALWMRWWNHVDFALHEALFFLHPGQLYQAPWFTLSVFVLACPVLIAFAVLNRRFWVAAAGVVVGGMLGFSIPRMGSHWGVGTIGPEIQLSRGLTTILAALVFASGFGFLDALWQIFQKRWIEEKPPLSLGDREIFWLLIPYTLALGFLMYTRGALWPRYWLPMLPIAAVMIMWTYYRWRPGQELPGICLVMTALVSAASVAYIHTAFAKARAQVTAEQEYMQAGYPRNELQAGFSSDGIYEIQLHGYVNDARITDPRRVYTLPQRKLPLECLAPVWELTPSLDRKFSVADQYGGCFQPMGLSPVEYRAWYPPFHRQVVLAKITPADVTP
jgi:hypothetical protein